MLIEEKAYMVELQDYEQDELHIQEDEASEREADALETVIQHELEKFQQQQALKYAELAAAGAWVPLPLPSPDPIKQQIRADERLQSTNVDQDPSWHEQERSEYIPADNAVERLWQLQLEQQQTQPPQPLSVFSPARPWSAAVHNQTQPCGHRDAEHGSADEAAYTDAHAFQDMAGSGSMAPDAAGNASTAVDAAEADADPEPDGLSTEHQRLEDEQNAKDDQQQQQQQEEQEVLQELTAQRQQDDVEQVWEQRQELEYGTDLSQQQQWQQHENEHTRHCSATPSGSEVRQQDQQQHAVAEEQLYEHDSETTAHMQAEAEALIEQAGHQHHAHAELMYSHDDRELQQDHQQGHMPAEPCLQCSEAADVDHAAQQQVCTAAGVQYGDCSELAAMSNRYASEEVPEGAAAGQQALQYDGQENTRSHVVVVAEEALQLASNSSWHVDGIKGSSDAAALLPVASSAAASITQAHTTPPADVSLLDTAHASSPAAVAMPKVDSFTAVETPALQRQSATTAVAEGCEDGSPDDEFIYQDDDEGSSSCSSPSELQAAAAAAANAPTTFACDTLTSAAAAAPPVAEYTRVPPDAAAAGAHGIMQSKAGIGCLSLDDRTEGSNGAVAPGSGAQFEPNITFHSAEHYRGSGAISPWPVEGNAAEADGSSSSTGCTPVPPQQTLQHARRPVHSRNRPAGTQSPLLDAAKAYRMGSTAAMAGAKVRPGSAPACRQSFSPVKAYGAVATCGLGAGHKTWIPGGATATQQQLLSVYGVGCSSRAATALRPHSSGGVRNASRPRSASPKRKPTVWQDRCTGIVAGCSTADAATVCGTGSAAATLDHYSNCGRMQQQQQQQRIMTRPASAPKARTYEPLQHSNAGRVRPSSSRAYSSSGAGTHHLHWRQQQQHQQQITTLSEDADASGAQYWMHDDYAGDCYADGSPALQLQQRKQRPQPAWDASPIPLSTPKTVPIAESTQRTELLVGNKAHRHSGDAANLRYRTHFAGSGAAVVRPRTAGAAAAAAIMREHPDSFGTWGVDMRNSIGSGGNDGSVYLVEIHQKLKQANSCCRKLGIGRHYCLAPSCKARWNLEQIVVDVWQYVAEVQELSRVPEQQEQQQAGWHLQCNLTLYQFNRQLDKLIAKAAAHLAATTGEVLPSGAVPCDGVSSNGSSWLNSPVASRSVSPDRSRPTSASTAAAAAANFQCNGDAAVTSHKLQLQQHNVAGVNSMAAGRAGSAGSRQTGHSSMLSPRRQREMQIQQQLEQLQLVQRSLLQETELDVVHQRHSEQAAMTVGQVQKEQGIAGLPYATPAWMQEHL